MQYIGLRCSALFLVPMLHLPAAKAETPGDDLQDPCSSIIQQLKSVDLEDLCRKIVDAPRRNQVVISSKTVTKILTIKIQESVSTESIREFAPELCQKEVHGVTDYGGPAFGKMLVALGRLPKEKRPRIISLRSFRVMGNVDLTNVELPFEVRLEDAIFCGHIIMRGLTADKPVILRHSIVLSGPGSVAEGILNAIGARFKSHFWVEESRLGAMLVNRATIDSTLSVANSRLGFLSVGNTVMARMVIRDAIQSNNIVNRVKKILNKPPESPLDPFPNELFDGYVEMVDAAIGADLDGDRFITEGPMVAEGASFRTIRLRNAKMYAVDFRHVQVSGNVHLAGAQFGATKLTNTKEDETRSDCIFGRVRDSQVDFVSFQGSEIRGGVFFTADYKEDMTNETPSRASSTRALCLNEINVGRMLDLSGLDGNIVNLRYAKVGGALVFSGVGDQLFQPDKKEGRLDLRNVEINVLDISERTPFPKQTWLRGAEFKNVEVEISCTDGDCIHTDIMQEARILVDFLENVDFDASGPEMYRVFQRTYGGSDHQRAAAEVAYAKEQRVTEHTGGWRKVVRYLSSILGGYGLKPERTLGVAMVFTILGAVVLFLSREGRIFLVKQGPQPSLMRLLGYGNEDCVDDGVTDGQLASCTFGHLNELWHTRWMIWKVFDALVFSFDRLIPILTISDSHRDIAFSAEPWIRTYFVVHTIVGWMLGATVLVVMSENLGIVFS